MKATCHSLKPQLLTAFATAGTAPAALAEESKLIMEIMTVELSLTSYILIGFLLILSLVMFFIFQHRFNLANRELKDVAGELGNTRQRLDESEKALEQSQNELANTTARYQGILFGAETGVFQMDIGGQCTYLNSALQKMSGLYPKKALQDGLESAIHPDDREFFQEAWAAFTEGDAPLNLSFRFTPPRHPAVHVTCVANKVYNHKKELESYIGWVADTTAHHEEKLTLDKEIQRHARFVAETVEGSYRLVPETPIPLDASPARIAEAIMSTATLAGCNNTFAAMYGAKPSDLQDKTISELKDGCGPFRSTADLLTFVEAGLKSSELESTRQDATGKRINLLNNVVGLVEDNMLVGIWGSQRNISRQKREQAELTSQVRFMNQILDTLPADVHVKDTRCRYLYASKRLARRTGIPQEDWIGKTIFEVMPATPHDHDQLAIETMKTSSLHRIERRYEAREKSGWLETLQIPLASSEGLVEGVVGLSLEITERKQKEEESRHYRNELETQLKNTQGKLRTAQSEYSKTATALSDVTQKLKMAEAEKANREHEYSEQLAERKRAEETLRRSEEGLLDRQRQLEEQLARRQEELDAETDKRSKWEELLSIRDDELKKIELRSGELREQLDEQTKLRSQAEADHETLKSQLSESREKLTALHVKHDERFKNEHADRVLAEKRLKKTTHQLQETEEQFRQKTEKHAAELEHEIVERKAAAEKLIENMEELDALKHQFSQRLENETKSIKQELASKQIREKNLRQHERELNERIRELEKSLQQRIKDHAEQVQARESAETECLQMKQELEQMERQQQELIGRETQKLNLSLAESRLNEVHQHQKLSDLQQKKEQLEESLKKRNSELSAAKQEHHKTRLELAELQASLKQQAEGQQQLLAEKTGELLNEVTRLQLSESVLRDDGQKQVKQIAALEESREALTQKVQTEEQKRRQREQELAELNIALAASRKNTDALVEQQTQSLQKQNEQYQQNETLLQQNICELQQAINERETELQQTSRQREEATLQMQQAEARLEQLKAEQQTQVAHALAETDAVGRMNTTLVDELNKAVCESLAPAVETTRQIGQAENLTPQQKSGVEEIGQSCRSLIDMMNYRCELTHLSNGSAEVKPAPCNLHELIHRLDRQFTHRAETKQLFFAVSFAQYQAAHNVPKLIETDEHKVHELLSILLGYALEHTEKGRLGLHAARKAGDADTATIIFEMAYTGTLNNDPLLTKIFGTADTPAVDGAIDGKYGLTLAKRYITLLNGKINLEYRDGGITTLLIELPFRKTAAEIIMPDEKSQEAAGAA